MTDSQFELTRITDTDWLLLDHRYGDDDPRRTVACVYEVEPMEVEVTWLRHLPLACRYQTAFDALDDLRLFYSPRSRAERPVRIPHFPPLAATA